MIGLLLFWSLRINAALKNQMHRNWHHVTEIGRPPAEVSRFKKRLAGFLQHPVYTDKIVRFLRIGLESVAVVFLFALLVAVGSRMFFTVVDAAGGICDANAPPATSRFGKGLRFDPTDPCFNTGLILNEGQTYKILFEVVDWKDNDIAADVKGWCADWCQTSTPTYLSLVTPIRRHLLADWYQPIARIDNKLLDRYPLEMKDPQPGKEQKKLVTTLTPRRTGQLYLYLNDAVLFTPSVIEKFYANNRGHAWVTVRESDGVETEHIRE